MIAADAAVNRLNEESKLNLPKAVYRLMPHLPGAHAMSYEYEMNEAVSFRQACFSFGSCVFMAFHF